MNLIILNGWSSENIVWNDFLEGMSPKNYAIISTFDVFGESENGSIESKVKDLVDGYARDFGSEYYLVGWSLGGMLAIKSYHLLDIKPKHVFIISAPVKPDVNAGRKIVESLRNNPATTLAAFMSKAMTLEEKKNMLKRKSKEGSMNSDIRALGAEEVEILIRGRYYLERGIDEEDVKGFDCECSWIHGDEDRICDFHKAEEIAKSIEKCSFYRIEGAGHIPFVTQGEKSQTIFRSVANT